MSSDENSVDSSLDVIENTPPTKCETYRTALKNQTLMRPLSRPQNTSIVDVSDSDDSDESYISGTKKKFGARNRIIDSDDSVSDTTICLEDSIISMVPDLGECELQEDHVFDDNSTQSDSESNNSQIEDKESASTGSSDKDHLPNSSLSREAFDISQNLSNLSIFKSDSESFPAPLVKPIDTNVQPLDPKNEIAENLESDCCKSDEKSPNKLYTPRQVREIEACLAKTERSLQANIRLLRLSNNLPDGGERLRLFISRLQHECEAEKVLLSQARKNLTDQGASNLNTINHSNDDQIENLGKTLRQLRLRYSAIRPDLLETDAKALSLKSQIDSTRRQLDELISKKKTKPIQPNMAWQELRKGVVGLNMGRISSSALLTNGPAEQPLYGGRMNQFRRMEIVGITQDAIKKLHDSLKTMPTEADEECDPTGLRTKTELYLHQRQCLAWLLWRETQHPPGGILADDMGLGKTLSMLALILKQKEIECKIEGGEDKSDEEWITKGKNNIIRSKATLIVCPASLLGQWENEVNKRIKRDHLRMLIYHGNNRDCSSKSMARNDLVITTYGTVLSEAKSVLKAGDMKVKISELKAVDLDQTEGKNVQLLQVGWERLILDEAHQIRNPQSQTSQAVCRLRAMKRWCVTGTPIQNKELDLYALIRFLRCSPFDEYKVWRQWVDNKTAQGQERLNTLMRCILLRRTKEQKSAITGNALVELPPKQTIVHEITLNTDERQVYQEVFSFSQKAMIEYMKKHDEAGGIQENRESKEDEYTFREASNGGECAKTPSFSMGLRGVDGDVKAYHLLVLLLRLRQICGHPVLIKSMLDEESRLTEGLEDSEGNDLDLITQMSRMSVGRSTERSLNSPVDVVENKKILDINKPVFCEKNISSKIAKIIEELNALNSERKNTGNMEKAVIVSQWTSMLNIIRIHVERMGMHCTAINGTVPVKIRGQIVEEFNCYNKGPQIMLLSLAAGGVGLNLVGANHLFLVDMHWNPQMEIQACDRIYRIGQKRNVVIHRFLCNNTVETRISDLQMKKLELAQDVLSGAKNKSAHKLTFDDLKMLFNVK